MELSEIAGFILDAGLVGGLIVGIWAFMTGKLWPNIVVERTLKAQQESAEKSAEIISTKISEELSNGIRKAMVEGIAEGYLKVNGGDRV